MKINKYRLAILTIISVFSFIYLEFNSVLAQDPESNDRQTETDSNNSQNNLEDKSQSEIRENEVKDKITETSPDSNKLSTETSTENSKAKENQLSLTAKEFLLLFAIIDLPILALLLELWFLNNKQQSENYQKLSEKQVAIAQQLKQLEGISSNSRKIFELQTANKKILEQIQENKQEITNSRIAVKDSIEKLTAPQPINPYNTPNISSSNNHSLSLPYNKFTEDRLDDRVLPSLAVADLPPQFVAQYNQDLQSISNKTIAIVVPTKESLNKQRLGDESKLILEETTQKKYWIIQEDNDSYLIPHAKIKIDEYNITILESIFNCINFTSDYQRFELVKPAKVSQLDYKLWQLEQKGTLEFS